MAGSPGLEGAIGIRPGDRIPLIPRQSLKTFVDYAVSPTFMLSLSMLALSTAFARGNENNTHQPDRMTYLGPGQSAGSAVFNLAAGYSVTPQWQLAAQVNNAFDARYSSAAQLGPTAFDASGNFVAVPLAGSSTAGYPLVQSTFYAPGAPRSVWISLRYVLDKPTR